MTRFFVAPLALGFALLALNMPAVAGPRDDVLFGISRCGAIADDRVWLDCVYGAAQPMRAQLGLPPALAAQQKLVPPATPGMAPPSFAAAAPTAPVYRPNLIERLTTPKEYKPEPPTTLTSYKFDGAGFFIVTLANGETWKQDQGDAARARWNKPAASYTAQILPDTSADNRLKVGVETFLVLKQK